MPGFNPEPEANPQGSDPSPSSNEKWSIARVLTTLLKDNTINVSQVLAGH